MSTNFSSNQFNSAFLPCHLHNYAIPRTFKEFPGQRRGCTTVIADNRGHILPKYHNQRSKSAWGHFMGTWQQPKKPVNVRIKTKLMARGLSGMPEGFGSINNTERPKSDNNIISEKNELTDDKPEDSGSLLGSNDSIMRHTNSRESVRTISPSVTVHTADSPLPPPSSAGGRRSATASRSSSACSIHSSAGCRPYTHGPGSPSEHLSSLSKGQRSDSRQSVKLPSDKPLSSGSGTRVSSAPVQSRSSSLSKTGGSSASNLPSQTASTSSSRFPHSSMTSSDQSRGRPNSSQQSIASVLEEDNETCTYYSNSRASSRASIASTTSTRSGVKCRGVQCGSREK